MTFGFLVTSLTKPFLVLLLSSIGRPTLGTVLLIWKFFHFRIIDVTRSFRNSFSPLPWSVPCHNFITGLQRVPWTARFGLDIQCELWDIIYTGVCPSIIYPVNSNATSGLQSGCRHIFRKMKANRMHLTLIWSTTWNGLTIFCKWEIFYFVSSDYWIFLNRQKCKFILLKLHVKCNKLCIKWRCLNMFWNHYTVCVLQCRWVVQLKGKGKFWYINP